MVLLWLVAAFLPGCSAPRQPAEPASQPRLPRFVYPSDPPVVGLEDLRAALVRLDTPVLLWVFERADRQPEARLLARQRDELRPAGVSVFGLFAGPPEEWRTGVTAMLKNADANFPCAVLDPSERAAVVAWLRGASSERADGVYALSRGLRVLASSPPDGPLDRDALRNVSSMAMGVTETGQPIPSPDGR